VGNVVPVWPTKVTVVCITATLTGWGLGWRSGYGTALLVGGSRDRSPVTGDQTVPCALGSTQPLKMSTRIFLGVKTAGA